MLSTAKSSFDQAIESRQVGRERLAGAGGGGHEDVQALLDGGVEVPEGQRCGRAQGSRGSMVHEACRRLKGTASPYCSLLLVLLFGSRETASPALARRLDLRIYSVHDLPACALPIRRFSRGKVATLVIQDLSAGGVPVASVFMNEIALPTL